MTLFTPREQQTLTALVDTLAPCLEAQAGENKALFEAGGVALGIPDLLAEALERTTDDKSRNDLKQFLRFLEVPLVNWLMARQWGAFSKLDLDGRTAVLRAWGNSRAGLARQAFQGIKRLTLFLFYAHTNHNPTWGAFDYKGAQGSQTDAPRPIQPLEITQPTTLETDVLIIGSGAGGGVLAGELSAAGYQVVILEKGGYHDTRDFDGNELTSNEQLFEKYGAMTTADLSMSVLAGNTLGGGTTINWAASLRPPDEVLHEWEHVYGFAGVTSPAYQASLEAVSQRLNIGTAESIPNPQNAALERGCQALGYPVHPIPRNVKGCEDCGYCGFGCPFGAKQGTLKTYLQDAYEHGAKIIVRAYVEKITHQRGVATGAVAQVQGSDGKTYPLTINAKAVIVAAGSIHTPALLMRSGLNNPNIGTNLHLHPVTTATGEYEQPIVSWYGAPMTRLFNANANLDGRGYGYRIETPPAHPGILGAAFPWQSGRQHREIMSHLHHDAHFIILVRDFHSGAIKLDKHGNPVVHYKLHPYDAKHMMHGLLEGLKLHRAAGAKIIYSPHNLFMKHHLNGEESFNAFLRRVEALGFQPNAYALFSAHQMGSCRIGGDNRRGAVKPNGESYEIKKLFVADASVFPTASGVNPMLTIMGTCHFLAQQIKAQL